MSATQEWVTPIGGTSRTARRRRAARRAEYRAEQERLAPNEALARLVIARRIRYGLTQEQLAERTGTSESTISRLESGQHRPSAANQYIARGAGGSPRYRARWASSPAASWTLRANASGLASSSTIACLPSGDRAATRASRGVAPIPA